MQIDRISNVIENTGHNSWPNKNISDTGVRYQKANNKMTMKSEQRIPTEDEIIDSIERANEKFIVYDRRFEFSIHEKTKQIMVKVIDVGTEEIIREIPPEKILDMVAAIWEAAGIFVDEKI